MVTAPVRIPISGKIPLGVKFSNNADTRRRKEIKLAKKIGERKVIGKLRALHVFNKNANPEVARLAREDAEFIASSFKGTRRVKTGTGLTKK